MHFCVIVLWASLSLLSAVLHCASILFPHWLIGHFVPSNTRSIHPLSSSLSLSHRSTTRLWPSQLGIYRRCGYPWYSSNRSADGSVIWHMNCGHYSLLHAPHFCWQLCLVLILLSVAFLLYLTLLLVMLSSCAVGRHLLDRREVIHACQTAQIVASVSALLAVFLFPIGWRNNMDVTQICGETADLFWPGRCQLGWAYVLPGMGAVLSLIAVCVPRLGERLLNGTSSNSRKLPTSPSLHPIVTSSSHFSLRGQTLPSAAASSHHLPIVAMRSSYSNSNMSDHSTSQQQHLVDTMDGLWTSSHNCLHSAAQLGPTQYLIRRPHVLYRDTYV